MMLGENVSVADSDFNTSQDTSESDTTIGIAAWQTREERVILRSPAILHLVDD
jgi:hypothetical protein